MQTYGFQTLLFICNCNFCLWLIQYHAWFAFLKQTTHTLRNGGLGGTVQINEELRDSEERKERRHMRVDTGQWTEGRGRRELMALLKAMSPAWAIGSTIQMKEGGRWRKRWNSSKMHDNSLGQRSTFPILRRLWLPATTADLETHFGDRPSDPCNLCLSATLKAWPLILPSKPSIFFRESPQEWLPDDQHGLEVGL